VPQEGCGQCQLATRVPKCDDPTTVNSPIVQIYTMQSVEEALAVAAVGVDHLGVTPSDQGLPGEITNSRAAEICSALIGVATSVALSVETDLDAIEAMVNEVGPDILHLCAPAGALEPARVEMLRRRIPRTPIMQAIAVTGPESVEVARSYARFVDYLILDSVNPNIAGVGAAGTIHDWDVSAAIVAAVERPVILAGGLSPGNVAAAIARVRPAGVDSLTHTNRPVASGGFEKDLGKVERFVLGARGATPSDE